MTIETIPSNELLRRFTVHQPTTEQLLAMAEIRAKATELAATIERVCPPGRERGNAVTHVEEALMWANKGTSTPQAPPARELTMETPVPC